MTPIIQKKYIFDWQILRRKNNKKFKHHYTQPPTPPNKVQSSKYFFQKLISRTCGNAFAACEVFKNKKRKEVDTIEDIVWPYFFDTFVCLW
jgi:acyl-CoA thioesterase